MGPRGRTHPGRSLEEALLETYDYVGGLDEVGRRALTGPISVGLAIVARCTDDGFPEGFVDSKQLTTQIHTALIGPVRGWLVDHAVAHASPIGIDEHDIIGALRVVGLRVLQQAVDRGHTPSAVTPDGVADWLTAPQPDLLTTLGSTYALKDSLEPAEVPSAPPVRMEVRTDARCVVVVVASVPAKVEHDRLMTDLDNPGYGWVSNKGYVSPAYTRGPTPLGTSDQHRRSQHPPDPGKRHCRQRLLTRVCGPGVRCGRDQLAPAACRLQRLRLDIIAR